MCKVEGCEGKVFAKGYCCKHYKQMYKYGEIRDTRIPNKYVFKDDYIELHIVSKGETYTVLIDKDDYDVVKKYSWSIKENYVYNSTVGLLHRYVLNPQNDKHIDHINHNKLDNRKNNLRECSQAENNRNVGITVNNTSGYKNIYWCDKKQRYIVRITLNGKLYRKHFKTLEEAIEYRDIRLKELHGEFYCLG